MKSLFINAAILSTVLCIPLSAAENDDHEHESHGKEKDGAEIHHEDGHTAEKKNPNNNNDDNHKEGDSVNLSPKQISMASIKIETVSSRIMDYQIYTPGEIVANGYTSYVVSPRVNSVVLRRHAALGDHVSKGDKLVTLFSSVVASAQGNFKIDAGEWRRAKKLGLKAVGEKRYVAAEANYNASYSRLRAYGLSSAAIESISSGSFSVPFGEYTLMAEIAGAVLSDDFQQGQHVSAGSSLMLLADETALWVEAQLSPTMRLKLPAGSVANINVDGEVFPALVTQKSHTIDPQTRTRVVRLIVENPSHRLHPGMFADVLFNFTTNTAVLAVPESALIQTGDGDWAVFVEDHPGEFVPREIELGKSLGQWREIIGIPNHSKIVTQGAFFVASQIAKSGFDPHNH